MPGQSSGNKFKYASFFTGAMGLDLGLELAGWECVFANEHDRVACQTIRMNRPNLNLVEDDIRVLTAESVLSGLEVSDQLDAVVGGPPCQAFSTAGRRLGLNDDRGNVFLSFVALATALSPRLIVIENVRGLLSAPLVHRPHAERGFGFEPLSPKELPGGALRHIVSILKSQGYFVSFNLYDTANFGVPQRRERLVLVASQAGKAPYLMPSHGNRSNGLPWSTLADAVKGLHAHHDCVPLRPNQLRFLKLLKAGQNWRDLPESLQREAMGNSYLCSGGRTGFYRRLDWDRPSPALVTSPTMPATLLGHPVEDRPLSLQEYARLQTFPDNWQFAGTIAQKYRQIGNAVPVEFGRILGTQIREWVEGDQVIREQTPASRYRATSDENWISAT